MSDHESQELRPAYRTLNDPSRLLGLSLGGWTTVLAAGALGYGWLMLSPFGWRANLSVVVVGLGAPAALVLLRESSTVSPGRLLLAVLRWRVRSPAIVAASDERPVRRGAIRLDTPPPVELAEHEPEPELPWVKRDMTQPS